MFYFIFHNKTIFCKNRKPLQFFSCTWHLNRIVKACTKEAGFNTLLWHHIKGMATDPTSISYSHSFTFMDKTYYKHILKNTLHCQIVVK